MTDVAEAVRARVDRRRAETVGFLQELIRLSAQGEAAVQARVARELAALGCVVETLRYRPADVPMKDEFAVAQEMAREERASIVARLRGTGGGRSVIFFAHPDGEPVTNAAAWKHDPFAGEIDGGRLHGWGVSDDLSGVATFVQALHAVVAGGARLRGDVVVASTPSKRHARGVAAVLHGGHVADAAVYLHPAESGAGMREIKAFASGLLEFTVTVTGREPDTREPSHTAFAHRAVNPIDKALVLHRALTALDAARAHRVHHPALDAAVGRSTNLLVSQIHCGDGVRLGRIQPHCVLGCTLAFPPPETLAQVQAEIEACVQAAAAADPWLRDHPPRLAFLAGVTGAEVKTEHPLYRITADAIVAATGEPPYVNPMHTSSDIRVPMVQKGIPTVGLGPLGGDLSQNGRTDEWVDVEDYLRGVKVAASIMVGWSG
ncbi:MAG: M20/M25/M40 family metallo-hydrolase [Alphaproteobacteria bacterium]|nr:M20/M25/M40 family metallo-hydrolase [Alphaproteobacteria bacterium]